MGKRRPEPETEQRAAGEPNDRLAHGEHGGVKQNGDQERPVATRWPQKRRADIPYVRHVQIARKRERERRLEVDVDKRTLGGGKCPRVARHELHLLPSHYEAQHNGSQGKPPTSPRTRTQGRWKRRCSCHLARCHCEARPSLRI